MRLQFFGAGSAFVELDKSMTIELSDIDFAAKTQTVSVYQEGESLGSFSGVGFRNNGLPYDSGVPNAEVFEFRTTGAGGGTMYLDNFSISPVPEPTSLALFGTGCVAEQVAVNRGAASFLGCAFARSTTKRCRVGHEECLDGVEVMFGWSYGQRWLLLEVPKRTELLTHACRG